PVDQKMAMLAVGGAYAPQQSMADRIRARGSSSNKVSRRNFNVALAVGWGMLGICGATMAAMFQDFFGPKVLREPKKVFRVGKIPDYGNPGVYDYKTLGFWIVNLQPGEERLVALSTICTHLGCIPDWKPQDLKFKCPCHGSGYYITGVNFEGPTPR